MVNEYLAENGSEALGIDGVTPTPAASDGSTDNADSAGEDTSSDEDNDTSGSGGEEGAWMENEAKKPLELYIHIPFCVKKCDYCDFLSGSAGKERQREYSRLWKGRLPLFRIFRTGRSPQFLSAEEHLPCRIRLLLERCWIRSEISFLWPRMLRSPSKQIRGLYIKKNFRYIWNTGSTG